MNEVVLTSDDSSSVYSSRFDALYHSKHGAIQESQHVFIQSGLQFFTQSEYFENNISIHILEIGLGTGLNAFLTLLQSAQQNYKVNYTGLEAYPIKENVVKSLNYPQILGFKVEFERIHKADWDTIVRLSDNFSIHKVLTQFEKYQSTNTYDIIYFDAFAPNTQEELWDVDMMKKMYSLSHNGSILVTYCAKGVVRRNMIEAGFEVSKIPGPPGKREMLRAIRTS